MQIRYWSGTLSAAALGIATAAIVVAAIVSLGCRPVEASTLPRVGTPAPDFEARAHNGQTVRISALRGHPVVLYFYPKDDTPGCTREACELRDAYQAIIDTGAVIIGVSTQDNPSHVAFAQKHRLPFLLVPDETGSIAKAYRVPLVLGLARRVTFIIGRDGNVAKVFPNVTPAGHAAEVLAAIQALSTA